MRLSFSQVEAMHQHAQRSIDDNVRRTVGFAALRKIHRLIATWESEERRARRVALVVASVLFCAIVAAVVIYYSSLQLVSIN